MRHIRLAPVVLAVCSVNFLDVIRSKRSLTAQELQRSLIKAAEEFRGPAEQNDDITLVVVKCI